MVTSWQAQRCPLPAFEHTYRAYVRAVEDGVAHRHAVNLELRSSIEPLRARRQAPSLFARHRRSHPRPENCKRSPARGAVTVTSPEPWAGGYDMQALTTTTNVVT